MAHVTMMKNQLGVGITMCGGSYPAVTHHTSIRHPSSISAAAALSFLTLPKKEVKLSE